MLNLRFAVKKEFESRTLIAPEIQERIRIVLSEWGYKVITNSDFEVIFKRDFQVINSRTPNSSQATVFYTHEGGIQIINSSDETIVKLNYTVSFWGEIIALVVLVGLITHFSPTIAAIGILAVILQFFARVILINKRCKEMLDDIGLVY